jgi:hypothetical protein
MAPLAEQHGFTIEKSVFPMASPIDTGPRVRTAVNMCSRGLVSRLPSWFGAAPVLIPSLEALFPIADSNRDSGLGVLRVAAVI